MKTLKTLESTVLKLDRNLSKTDASFRAAVIMLATIEIGKPNIHSAVRFTHYQREEVSDVIRRMRNGGLWKLDQKEHRWQFRHSGWFEKESGGIAFWMDVLICQGFINRMRKTARGSEVTA